MAIAARGIDGTVLQLEFCIGTYYEFAGDIGIYISARIGRSMLYSYDRTIR